MNSSDLESPTVTFSARFLQMFMNNCENSGAATAGAVELITQVLVERGRMKLAAMKRIDRGRRRKPGA